MYDAFMGRDLLYKPQTPAMLPEDDAAPKKGDKQQPGNKNQVGRTVRARELGQVGEPLPSGRAPSEGTGKARAFQNPYFNKDSATIRQANLNSSTARALRGGEGASDLRKVVLPPAIGVDEPEPGRLRGALDLMGLEEMFEADLSGLLSRQGAWARAKGVTKEMLEARQAQLEEMVEARKAALGRMAEGKSDRPITSCTLVHAATVAGQGVEQADDLAAAGNELIERTTGQADGMHRRLAKMLGIKLG